jgi:hypothetical protein
MNHLETISKMTEIDGTILPDLSLIEKFITEVKVSSRAIAVYPRDHPAVHNSLNRVYSVLQEIFQLRPGITLAVGRETFVIDTHPLDKKNHIFRQFAQHLRRLGIAYMHFSPGLTLDQLYNFQRFISVQRKDLSSDGIRESLSQYDLSNINVGFLDYEAFSFEEGKTSAEITQENLWETYIVGIINGTLRIEEISEELDDIPLDTFTNLLTKLGKHRISKISSKNIVSLYMKKFFQKTLTNREIKKLLASINELPSDLQEQLLSMVIEILSKDILVSDMVFQNISAELIMELFEEIRSRKIDIPENLRNLLEVVLKLEPQAAEQRTIGENLLVDDIFLPSDMADIQSKSDMKQALSDSFETSVSDEYQKEINHILEFDSSEILSISLPDLKREINDDFIDKTFNHVILEIMSSELISPAEYRQLIQNLKEWTGQFMLTGQYEQILRIRRLLQLNLQKKKFTDITSESLHYYSTSEFITAFIDSLKIMGRQSRDEAWQLCEDYGGMIIPFLIDALMNEETQSFRSLLMSLIRQYGDALVPEALSRLNDSRWFVKRNMLYLLTGCKNEQIIPYVRPYCRHENPKVSLEAIKCLLSLEDRFGLERIHEYLRSGTQAEIEQAISLLSAYRIKDAVPDLVQILRKKVINKTTLSQKIAIIQALGNIGDLSSLDAFREIIFRKKFIFFKSEAENLKLEIYKTLKNYPYKDIEDIIQRGLKSSNEYIRNESLRLTKMRKE